MLAAAPLSDRDVELRAAGGAGELAAVLALHGFATFDGVLGEDALLQLAGRLGQIVRHRDSGSSGVTVITDRSQPAARQGRRVSPPRLSCRTRTARTSSTRPSWSS
jgi:hypothetical protein